MHDSATPFAAFKSRWQPAIEHALADLAAPSGAQERLAEAMRYSLLSQGKRIRPLLVLAAADTCGGNVERAIHAACALEMAHVSSLILDDLPAMDDDDTRRGKLANHKVYGEATAILASNALLARAFELLAEYSVGAVLCKELAAALGAAGMCGGQSDDIQGGVATFDDLMKMHAGKTGALIRASVRIGAILSDAEAQKIESLSQYGDAIGLAFQITDDLLDREVEKEKVTFPSLLGVEKSKEIAGQKTDEALRSLESFGPKAEVLRDLTHAILARHS
ncbi:hypothetical protein A3A39_00240 [Candidatus Kaiserbacteria bacterium RIFCSPLOWO2_01_FULL_54_13]|uniref:Polyprenyl synthetase n=1 Tax=Candidatus Kaiserbacteria bacterium RIFCSPLOWO2_01_FULL_54_13 TaxID=1798512 RepID=A0A1F6F3R5_9BACT|nr:MAG: hypothetical protein A3A39_00240 [Candidatus Kaiserbacteria bacterium RIFCSPLOWO2_01_FULL_54_13]